MEGVCLTCVCDDAVGGRGAAGVETVVTNEESATAVRLVAGIVVRAFNQ